MGLAAERLAASTARRDRAAERMAARIIFRGVKPKHYRAHVRLITRDVLKLAEEHGVEADASWFGQFEYELSDQAIRDHVVAARPRSTSRARESHRGRAGHRRGTRSTRAGPDPDEPEPALRLAPPPKTIYRFACLSPEQRGET